MRIRQIKPSFWTDAAIAELPAPTRLFYIGLWMLADDGGWLRWEAAQVANELYGYEPRGRRERAVVAMMAALETAGRVVIYPCGHAQVPTLKDHQRLAGETHQVRTIEREHAGCPRIPADTRVAPLVPDTVRNGRGKVRNVESRNGTSPAREDSPAGSRAESEFAAKVPRPS